METQLDIISIDGRVFTLFAVDIGNSAIKFFSKGTFFHISYKSDWQQELDWLLGSLSNQNVIFSISSVNYEKLEYLSNKINSNIFFRSILVDELLSKQQILDLSLLQGIGNDRILGLIGGLNYCKPPFLTVDLGTATTFNLLDDSNRILGGAIMPGIFTQYRSLIEHTSALKKIRLEHPATLIGKNTNEAVSSGIVNGMLGSVIYFIDMIRKNHTNNLHVLITGGNAGWIIDELQNKIENVQHLPTLVLEGIISLTKQMI